MASVPNRDWAALDRATLPADATDLRTWDVDLPSAGCAADAPLDPAAVVAELRLGDGAAPLDPAQLTWAGSARLGDRETWLWHADIDGVRHYVAVWRRAVGDVGCTAEPDRGWTPAQFALADYYDYFARRWRLRFKPRFDVPKRPWPATMPKTTP